MVTFLTLGHAALAGYGDARDGLPAYVDRETFFWTNAVRIAPDSFADDYPCDFDRFAAGEKTSKPPLLFNADLTDASFYHSDDMRRDGYFDHDSNDGTSWDRRIHRYYDGAMIGENIAYGYPTAYDAVVGGWMCSSGHRANIMNASYNELGVGVSGTYYTQDFGYRGSAPDRAMAMGFHAPKDPSGQVSFYVDWSGAAPDALYVVANGVRHDLSRVLGTDSRGVFGVTLAAGSGCQPYHFVGESGGRTETWPQDGSYGYGGCDWDDDGARWLADQVPLAPDEEPGPTDTGTGPADPDPTDPATQDPEATGPGDDTDEGAVYPEIASGCGCDGAPGSFSAGAVAALLVAGRRRAAARRA